MAADARLEETLARLRSEIDGLGLGDEDARQRLRRLVADIERSLAEPGPARGGLAGQLRNSVLRFEATHPRIAAVMNEMVEQLGNMGI